MTRRELLTSMAATAAMSAAEAMFPGILFAASAGTPLPADGVAWRKTPCRFCGVGCGLLVGISSGRAVAVKGDPASPVNRGLCCMKGYHSVMALYGAATDYPELKPDDYVGDEVKARAHVIDEKCTNDVALALWRCTGLDSGRFPTATSPRSS